MFVLHAGWATESGRVFIGLFTTYEKAVEKMKYKDSSGNVFNQYTVTHTEPDINNIFFTDFWRLHKDSYYQYTTPEEWAKRHGELDYRLD